MAAFSIYTHEGETKEPSTPEAKEPAGLTARGPSPSPAEPILKTSKRPHDFAKREEIAPPKVVLQLPNIEVAEPAISGRRFTLSSFLSWAGIVLGAGLAVALIWGPGSPARVRPVDEAPAWTPTSTPRDIAAPLWSVEAECGQSAAPSQQPQETETHSNPPESPVPESAAPESPVREPREPALEQPTERLDGPSFDREEARRRPAVQGWPQADPANPAQSPPEVRTARSLDARGGSPPRWDGSSRGAKPSEAAPLGITTPVPQ